MAKIIFVDTMIFLHYRMIDELDLCTLLDTSEIIIVVPRITLRELDKNKNINKSEKIRERAKKILLKLETWITTSQPVRNGVSVKYYAENPSIDFQQYSLNPDWSDDQLLASILQFQMDNPGEEICLITQDSGPRLTAYHLGIPVIQLPEEYRLPQELDPTELENQQLKKTLERIRTSLPQLAVCFAGSNDIKTHARFVLPKLPEATEDEVRRTLEKLRQKLPKLNPVKSIPEKESGSLATLATRLSVWQQIDPISPEEYGRYNNEVDEFLSEYEKYMRTMWEYKDTKGRTIEFQIEIRNTGTAPADDVDVEFYFPNGFHLFTKDNFPVSPERPKPPRKPRTRSQILSDSLFSLPHLASYIPTVPNFKSPISFNLKRTSSYNLTDHFTRIKHGDSVVLPELFLTFESLDAAKSFNCTYVIRPANLPEPVTGQLNFVIEKNN